MDLHLNYTLMRKVRIMKLSAVRSERSENEQLMVGFCLLKDTLYRTPVSWCIALLAIISYRLFSGGHGFLLVWYGLGVATLWSVRYQVLFSIVSESYNSHMLASVFFLIPLLTIIFSQFSPGFTLSPGSFVCVKAHVLSVVE